MLLLWKSHCGFCLQKDHRIAALAHYSAQCSAVLYHEPWEHSHLEKFSHLKPPDYTQRHVLDVYCQGGMGKVCSEASTG